MAQYSWDVFLPELLPELPGVTSALARNTVRDFAIEFCQKTHLWKKEDLGPISIVASTAGYELTPPAGADIVVIEKARIGERFLHPVNRDELDYMDPNWRYRMANPPTHFTAYFDNIVLYPAPAESLSEELYVDVALAPKRTATDFEDFLFDRWGRNIAAGAKAFLMHMPDKSWTNPSMGDFYSREYSRGVSNAKMGVNKGQINKTLTAKSQSFI